ncbi:MAG TPA: methanogenesis marker 16 metalloprotein [Candidatus Syntrophoarchaeum butanivorans]|uniref:Methanogenesis marker 16 metalloprotein n=1 Tax=Candidatus Syntropharchaeum butanivorans TaxID=1839936 RepID=A0A1F2P6Z5_9EURY|nr:MAG: methanogenesis marker 16 metalloprotein [Candidatus Syntrophoarchaeum butanivorans]HEC56627.1 methanogenesis marker 16 metalloprotein [Candidatus Syntrophoarchaeum butanivorans]
MKSIAEINEKIKKREAIVMTAREVSQIAREGGRLTLNDVDVVTTATRALMSGTFAVLSMPVTERGVFKRAKKVWLNGIPAFPGPCPNERLGIIDVIVYGTSHSETNPRYGGGHLFRDIVRGEKIEVCLESDEKIIEKREVGIEEMFARMITTRSAFRNYMGFVNTSDDAVKTIFNVIPMEGPYKHFTFTGCGEINPIENDPTLRTIRVGTKILVNEAIGYVMGTGTRSTPEKPNLSVFAEMYKMNPEYMGGFLTSEGPEVINSIAVPIPVIDEKILRDVMVTDEQVELPVAEIHDRIPFHTGNYGEVWKDVAIRFFPDLCLKCDECDVERLCPTGAYRSYIFDERECFNCGLCVSICRGKAFKGDLGKIKIGDRVIPVFLRFSDRLRAERLSQRLKEMIEEGDFFLSNV